MSEKTWFQQWLSAQPEVVALEADCARLRTELQEVLASLREVRDEGVTQGPFSDDEGTAILERVDAILAKHT